MSPESVALVRQSWCAIAPHADAMAERFYEQLFALDWEARALFAHVDLPAQRTKFLKMIDTMIAVLDDPGAVASLAILSGRRHAGYGVQARDYELGRAALMRTLQQELGAEWTPALRDAWRELYALIAAAMRRAGEGRAGAPVDA